MSLSPRLRPAHRRFVPALLLAAAVLTLPGCSSGDGNGDATPVDTRSVIDLIVTSGTGIRGVEAQLSFDSVLALSSVQAVGSFSGQTCEANVGSNFARLLCARDDASIFNAPATLWRLTMDHSSAIDPLDFVLSLQCVASDALGNTFPVACTLE